MKKVILASASPRRRELLSMAGVDFQVIPGQGQEIPRGTTIEEIVKNLGEQKAAEVAERIQDQAETGTVVIGADTVVVKDGKLLGKPDDAEDAEGTLSRLQGTSHQVWTGVCARILTEEGWQSHTFGECTEVYVYPMTKEEIRDYVVTGEPMDKAGSYGIQGRFGIYVEKIHGDYNNVVGLPVARLLQEMKKLGIDLRRMDK